MHKPFRIPASLPFYVQEFHKISTHLDRRSTRDCVVFYYRIQRQDEFALTRRKMQVRLGIQAAAGSLLAAASAPCIESRSESGTWGIGLVGDVQLLNG